MALGSSDDFTLSHQFEWECRVLRPTEDSGLSAPGDLIRTRNERLARRAKELLGGSKAVPWKPITAEELQKASAFQGRDQLWLKSLDWCGRIAGVLNAAR